MSLLAHSLCKSHRRNSFPFLLVLSYSHLVHVADGERGEGDLVDGHLGGVKGDEDGAALPAVKDLVDEEPRHGPAAQDRQHPF